VSIELYREGLPRVEINSPAITSREGMLVGLVESDDHVAAILMTEDGQLTLAALSDFRIQFHYDVEKDDWVDEHAQTDRE